MHILGSVKHKMFVEKKNKKSFSAKDDKRYILADGILTLPHKLINYINKYLILLY